MPVRRGPESDALGSLESQVLAIVWELKKGTVSDVLAALNNRGTELAYTTIMTVLSRLTDKGLLKRKFAGRSYLYEARVSEQQFKDNTARALARRLVQGFDHLAIASFVDEVEKDGPARLQELLELVEKAASHHDLKD